MTLKIHNVEQGTPEWHEARRGVITASRIGTLLTDTGKTAKNDKTRRYVLDLLSERISGFVEEIPMTYSMERGHDDEEIARNLYSEKYDPVEKSGFVTNDKWGFTIGYSPDGLVGERGLIECKSMLHALHTEAIISRKVPVKFLAQIQCGLAVFDGGRDWVDYIGPPARGGGKIMVKRVWPDDVLQARLIEVAAEAEAEITRQYIAYGNALTDPDIRFIDMPRYEPENEQEIVIDG